VSLRLAITFFVLALGVGYLFALLNVYIHYSKADGEPGLSTQDLVRTFYGPDDKQSLLEAKLLDGGSMRDFLPDPLDRGKVITWVKNGAPRAAWDKEIESIISSRCMTCHNRKGLMSLVPMESYEDITVKSRWIITRDRGRPLNTLVQSSHTHLISMAMMFAAMAALFFCTGAPGWLKNIVTPLPFVGVLLEVGGWWITKFVAAFAYAMTLSGALMGTAFAVFAFGILGECWFARGSSATAAQLSDAYKNSRS
jgi:hypothetical protein